MPCHNSGMDTKTLPQTLNLRLSSLDEVAITANQDGEPRRFSGIANSGLPFGLGSWQSVIDFDGIKLKDKTAFLIDHDGRQRAGVGSLSVTSDGLLAQGALLDNEYGKAVAAESDQGFPWEMSVYVQSGRTEEVVAGAKASVNGRELQGPLLILRDCRIREVSFTAVGVDGNTHAVALSDNGEPQAFDYQPATQEQLSMTPQEKAEFDQLRAANAALEKENAELKLSAQTANINAKLSAAGFKADEKGKFGGISEATYNLLLSADAAAVDAIVADLKPTQQEKPQIPEALLSDRREGFDGNTPAAGAQVKLSAATAASSFNNGAQYV